jgi:hypothetical protein
MTVMSDKSSVPSQPSSTDVRDGDVIEIAGSQGDVTALVLLATDTTLVLDLCDDSTPLVFDRSELRSFRVFRPTELAAVA